MKEIRFEAYSFYKQEYATGVLLFHVGSNFEMYEQDADLLWKILRKEPALGFKVKATDCAVFQEENLEMMMKILAKNDVAIHIIEYRNEKGEFDVPKVKQIINDINDDY